MGLAYVCSHIGVVEEGVNVGTYFIHGVSGNLKAPCSLDSIATSNIILPSTYMIVVGNQTGVSLKHHNGARRVQIPAEEVLGATGNIYIYIS